MTSIGYGAFYGCPSLTSISIPNSVTSIGDDTFEGCTGLTSITIPNSVTSIGGQAFEGCSGLTSITIPSSVTNIVSSAFWDTGWYNAQPDGLLYLDNCFVGIKGNKPSGAVTIKDGTRIIAGNAFFLCTGLTSITIPNSVTSIGNSAFYGCRGLTSITIPNSVTSIGEYVFNGCTGLESVISLPETPPVLNDNSFPNYDIPLYVPETAIETYQTTSPWSNFAQISKVEQCAKPTIAFQNGKISLSCETEGVEFIYSYTTPTMSSNNTGSEFSPSTKFAITVYAKKNGYLDSEPVTQEIDVRGLKGDVNDDGAVDIADAVKIVNLVVGKIDALSRPAKDVKDEKEPQ